jgi:SAM-dependent methyltransferase
MAMNELLKRYLCPFYRPVVRPDFTYPIYYQLPRLPKNRLFRLLYGSVPHQYELIVNERSVEMPFVFHNLQLPKGAKVLDFGCNESPISIHLASLGYQVVGVDLNCYPFSHPNFQFFRGDFLQAGFPDNEFDGAIAVSALEHCGLGAYNEAKYEAGDYGIVNEIYRVLKPTGKFILTVPFGLPGQTSWYRVYDRERLDSLLEPFQILKREYSIGVGRKSWVSASEEKVALVDSVTPGFTQGVVCVLAQK